MTYHTYKWNFFVDTRNIYDLITPFTHTRKTNARFLTIPKPNKRS